MSLDDFKPVHSVPDEMKFGSKYRSVIEEFMASGNRLMFREFADKHEARRFANSLRQYYRSSMSRYKRTENGFEMVSELPGFKVMVRGIYVYLLNENVPENEVVGE